MLNLFVAVIMDNFEFLTRDSSILGPHHLDKFPAVWSDFDPHATGQYRINPNEKTELELGRMDAEKLPSLLTKLDPPVGLGDNAPQRLVYKKLIEMNIPIDELGQVTFRHTIVALIRTGLTTKKITKEESSNVTFRRQKELDREMRKEVQKKWKLNDQGLDEFVPDPDAVYDSSTGKMFGVLLMFDHWKVYNDRKTGIEEARAEIEKQKFITNQLEKLKKLEEELDRTDQLPPSGVRSGVLGSMNIATIIAGRPKDRPVPRPRKKSMMSTTSCDSRNALIAGDNPIESTAFVNDAYENDSTAQESPTLSVDFNNRVHRLSSDIQATKLDSGDDMPL